MNRLAVASLCSVISLAREQRERSNLAHLMMLHDDLVHKFDQEANEADANSGLFERFWGGNKDEKDTKEGDQQDKKPEEDQKSKSDDKQTQEKKQTEDKKTS